jgi:hypothetical protein
VVVTVEGALVLVTVEVNWVRLDVDVVDVVVVVVQAN